MDMRYRLLLQQEADGLLLPEQAVVAEAAKFSNWYESASQFLYRPCGKTGAKELDKYILSPTTLTGISEVGTAPAEAGIEDIPIGSIEFVETFLSSRYGIDHLTPIFIPPQIQPKRKTSIVTGSAGVQAFMSRMALIWSLSKAQRASKVIRVLSFRWRISTFSGSRVTSHISSQSPSTLSLNGASS